MMDELTMSRTFAAKGCRWRYKLADAVALWIRSPIARSGIPFAPISFWLQNHTTRAPPVSAIRAMKRGLIHPERTLRAAASSLSTLCVIVKPVPQFPWRFREVFAGRACQYRDKATTEHE